jgi:hypothetical protein
MSFDKTNEALNELIKTSDRRSPSVRDIFNSGASTSSQRGISAASCIEDFDLKLELTAMGS